MTATAALPADRADGHLNSWQGPALLSVTGLVKHLPVGNPLFGRPALVRGVDGLRSAMDLKS